MNRLQEKETGFMNKNGNINKPTQFGLYIHVPFCAKTCDYCSFYQEKPQKDDINRYLDAIELEFSLFPPKKIADTVFFGGGTPGLLTAKDFNRLAHIIKPHISKDAEWTVEMAPSTVKEDKLETMLIAGVNRISMGIQSFNKKYLEILGRQHSREKAISAYHTIRRSGFDNINIDFIFAVPGQNENDWKNELRQAFELNPEHISTYCLIFEEDAALYLKFSEGKIKRDEEIESRLFELTWQEMDKHGYKQYEIANYAKPGKSCQHNIHTWEMQEWRGYGPSAASQLNNQRFANVSSLNLWIESLEKKQLPTETIEELTDQILLEDCLSFGLRMNHGVHLPSIQNRFPSIDLHPVKNLFQELIEEGILCAISENEYDYFLSPKGRLIADQVGSEIMNRFA